MSTRTPFHCDACDVDLWFDRIRRRYTTDDGAAHVCPPPELGYLRECICGTVVTVFSDGRRITFKTNEPHSHEGMIETKPQQPQVRTAPALWDAYKA